MSLIHRCFLRAVAGILGSVICGCGSVNFYAQAVAGQAEILSKARPIQRVMQDEKVPDEVKEKLAVAEEARRFAGEQLELPTHRQFDRYTHLGRRYVSWVVYAAPEFSVEGKEWWYPVVGSLEYRGFFNEKTARKEAAHWKALGYDVYVGGVEAYSTLGWFRDPILNTFFRRTDSELAELIFHELTHVKVFVPGDTDFNEAFATASAEAGVTRWLRFKGDRDALARYEATLAKDREIIRLQLATRKKLNRLYQNQSISIQQMRQEKAAIFAHMNAEYALIRQRWHGDSRFDRTFATPWNNARLNTVATYYDLVPGFDRILERERGDLKSFYSVVEGMRHRSKEERRILLNQR
jgi:predicted aminopeptidase